MRHEEERTLSDADVKAIVTGLKAELVRDFQLEVGRGVFAWVKRMGWWLLLLAALYGVSTERGLLRGAAKLGAREGDGRPPVLVATAVIEGPARRALRDQGFAAIPSASVPAELDDLAHALGAAAERTVKRGRT